QRLHQGSIVGDRIDHFDGHAAGLLRPDLGEVDIGGIIAEVALDRLGAGKNRVGDLLRRRPAIADIVLDAEIPVRAARIVRGGEDDATERLVMADLMAEAWRRQQSPLPHQGPPEAIGRRNADDALDGDVVEIAAVAADYQRLALEALKAVEDRLHEIFDIVALLEYRHPLAQAGGSGLLVRIGRGLNLQLAHRAPVPVAIGKGRRSAWRSRPTKLQISCRAAAACATLFRGHTGLE